MSPKIRHGLNDFLYCVKVMFVVQLLAPQVADEVLYGCDRRGRTRH